jgi:hypothetical protein
MPRGPRGEKRPADVIDAEMCPALFTMMSRSFQRFVAVLAMALALAACGRTESHRYKRRHRAPLFKSSAAGVALPTSY